MSTRRELMQLAEQIEGELSHRTKFGGYDANAPLFIQLLRWQLQTVRHLIDAEEKKAPVKKKRR